MGRPGWPWGGKRVEFIPQMEATECGAAALAMVLAFHGHHTTLPDMRQACGISRDGAHAQGILQAALARGLEAEVVSLDLDQLGDLPLPAILHWDFDHFVVLERMHGNGIMLVDPASGRRHASMEEVGRRFTGIALVFRATPDLAARPRSPLRLGKYRMLFRARLPALALLLLSVLALEAVGLVFPVASQILLDRVVMPNQASWLWGLAVGMGSAATAAFVLGLARARVVMGLQIEWNFALMDRFLGHLVRLPLGFFLLRDPGDLVQRIQSNTELQDLLSTQAVTTLLDGLLLLGYGCLMVAYHPLLAGLVMTISMGEAGLLAALWNRNRELLATGLAAQGREGAALIEAISEMEATKAGGAESRLVHRWTHRMIERVNNDLDQQRLNLTSAAVLTVLTGSSTLLVFLIGGREVLDHRMTLGTFIAFLTLQGLFAAPVSSILAALLRIQTLGSHLRRLEDVLETPAETPGGADPGRLRGAIELQEVTCRYSPQGAPVLDRISLRIAPGEKVALVGPSGAGKSTLARVLMGLHVPDSGRVLLDGQDLRGMDLGKVRKQMGVVMQETFLFDDTVRANLSMLGEELPPEQFRQAVRMACAEAVIDRLPKGFSTRIGENGGLLSGGERQRLSLARALVNNPVILLLDEATSALDLETERRVHANLQGLGCTRILIAHRMATVQDADRIVVLEAGRIVQEGTFESLRGCPGLFRDLLREADHA